MTKKLPAGFAYPLILLAVGLIVGIGITFAYFQFKSKSKPAPQPVPTIPQNTSQSSPTSKVSPTATTNETANWKTYTNSKYHYSLNYPTNWFIGGPYGGQFNELCSNNVVDKPIVEFSATDLTGKGCGFVGEQLPGWDITIWANDYTYPNLNNILADRPSKETTVAGVKAIKYVHTKDSNGPDVNDTRIYFNYNNKGYLIFLKQSDQLGTYDTIYDKILSTFKFL